MMTRPLSLPAWVEAARGHEVVVSGAGHFAIWGLQGMRKWPGAAVAPGFRARRSPLKAGPWSPGEAVPSQPQHRLLPASPVHLTVMQGLLQ